jgi:hypothetical protein
MLRDNKQRIEHPIQVHNANDIQDRFVLLEKAGRLVAVRPDFTVSEIYSHTVA